LKDFLNTLYNSMPLFLDIEATSGDYFAEIIDFAIVDLDENILFNSKFKPEVKIFDPYAISIHGITYKDLSKEQSFLIKADHIKTIVFGKSLISYNAYSDARYLSQTYKRYDINMPILIYCLANIYKHFSKLRQPISMKNLAKKLDIPAEEGYHRALSGAICASRIFRKIYEQYR